MTPLLRVRNIRRRFGGLTALDGVGFDVAPGEIKGVIGPNGAGKTTLFNILSGLLRPDIGMVALAGRTLTGLSPAAIARAGLARTFQNVSLFDRMTARENVMTGLHLRSRAGLLASALRLPRQRREERDLRRRADGGLASWGLPMPATPPWRRFPSAAAAWSSWRARSPSNRSCCCSTSPPAASTPARAASWRR